MIFGRYMKRWEKQKAAFRPIRKLTITEENNFALDRSDSVAEKAMNSLGFLLFLLR